MNNPLRKSGKPLFFKVGNAGELNLAAPKPRLGQSVRLAVRSLSVMQKEALVINSQTGHSVDYQARRQDIEGRSFETVDGRLVTGRDWTRPPARCLS